jgi:hypothetical protein
MDRLPRDPSKSSLHDRSKPRDDGYRFAPPILRAEWDVNQYVKGVNRGAERIVLGSDGGRYYTSNHYQTFTKF